MNKYVLIALFAAVAFSCSRPPSDEPFVRREDAEYGDTYTFLLDMADSTITYGLDFYTRLERKSFGTFPEDSLVLALRWIAPSDSNYVDTSSDKSSYEVGDGKWDDEEIMCSHDIYLIDAKA